MTQQACLPSECLPDHTTGKYCLASVFRMTQQASLPSECLPDLTAGKSAYRVSAG